MCGCVLLAYMSVYHICSQCPCRTEEGVRHPGGGVTDDCELPAMLVLESKVGLREEKPVSNC